MSSVALQGSTQVWAPHPTRTAVSSLHLEGEKGDNQLPAGKLPWLGDVHQGRSRCQGAYAVRKDEALERPCIRHSFNQPVRSM